MRILKRLLQILVLLILAMVAIAYLLPREMQVARSVEINAVASEIFPHVNNLKANEAWSPWLSRDPEVQLNYGAVAEGVGATMSWASEHPQVGSGSMEIITSEPDTHLKTALDFGDMGTAVAFWDLVETDGKTNVTWGFTSDAGMNPVMRWMGLMMDGWVGPDYEQGLGNLKALVEG